MDILRFVAILIGVPLVMPFLIAGYATYMDFVFHLFR